MQYCKFCGTALAPNARFCSYCGLSIHTGKATDADSTVLPTISSSFSSNFAESSNLPSSVHRSDDRGQNITPTEEEKDEEERRRLLGLPLLGTLASEGQAQPNNVPMVHGTPQVSGVPSVEGTESPQHMHASPAHLHHQVSHGFRPQAKPSQVAAHHHQVSLGFRPQATTSESTPAHHLHPHRVLRHVKGRWVTVAVTSVVVVASVISALALLLPANLTLSGGTIVSSGGTLHLHGEGFLPGSRVRLTLDNHTPLFFAVQPTVMPGGMGNAESGGQTFAYASEDAAVMQVVTTQLMKEQAGAGSTEARTAVRHGLSQDIQVGVSGSFDVTVAVSSSWSAGRHSIRAIESVSSVDVQSVGLTFQIEPTAAKLVVAPLSLNFGQVRKGNKATQTVAVSNVGEQPLQWAANVGTASWLGLTTSSGTVQPGSSQTIQLTANTAQLSPGHYTATLAITAGNQSQLVPVSLSVTTLQASPPPPQHCPSGEVGTPPNCQPQQCPPGEIGTPPNCHPSPPPQHCPSGEVGTPPNCYHPAPQHCPSGEVGTPPNCQPSAPPQCPSGLVGAPPNCQPPAPQHCPSGEVGTPPNCYHPAPQHCPSGEVGTPPNCYHPAPQHCPSGEVGTPPNCYHPAPQHCPSGEVGTPPNCYHPAPQHCPSGEVGTPPNCHPSAPPQCPPGTFGTPPECHLPTCPSGLVGTPPNCHEPECPSGEIGTPPNCYHPEPQPCPPGEIGKPPNCYQPQPQTCPPGEIGKPPNCYQPQPQCPPGTQFLKGQCIPVCPPGQQFQGGQCIPSADTPSGVLAAMWIIGLSSATMIVTSFAAGISRGAG
jgi:hypothetical protein